MKFLKLTQKGIAHYVVPMIVIVGIAIGGVAYLVASHADPIWNYIGAPPVGILPGTGVAATSIGNPQNRQDIFVTGNDHAVWHRWESYGQWSGWENLGGWTASAPGASSQAPYQLIIVARGSDNAIWYKRYGLNAWTGWQSLGGQTLSSPSVSGYPDGKFNSVIVVRGTDNHVYYGHLINNGQSWTGWIGIGGITYYSPAVIGTSSYGSYGEYDDIFAVGTNNAVWGYKLDNTNGWYDLFGGCVNAGIAATTDAIAVRGCDNKYYYMDYKISGAPWTTLGGYLAGSPGVIVGWGGSNPFTAYVIGGNNGVYTQNFNE